MKFLKAAALLFACIFPLLSISCNKNTVQTPSDTEITGESVNIEGSCEEIIERVYSSVSENGAVGEYLSQLITVPVTEKNEEYFLGISDIPYCDGASSESSYQPVTYSFTVVRIAPGEDVEECRSIIRDNANPSKWVCMTAQECTVVKLGDLIAVIMGSKEVCTELEAAFLALSDQGVK